MDLSDQQAADVLRELPRLCRAVQQVLCTHLFALTQPAGLLFLVVDGSALVNWVAPSLRCMHWFIGFSRWQATGSDGINVLHNGGSSAGQVVFHLHFHVVPRFEGDGLFSQFASSKTMITQEEAAQILAKIKSHL